MIDGTGGLTFVNRIAAEIRLESQYVHRLGTGRQAIRQFLWEEDGALMIGRHSLPNPPSLAQAFQSPIYC